MALNTVALVLDLYDGTQSPITSGTATFRPNVQVKDSTDHVVLTTAPVIIQLVRNPVPTVTLIATDNAGLSPTGWTWIYRGTFDGAGVEQAFFLPFSGGSTQYLSQLVPTSSTPMAAMRVSCSMAGRVTLSLRRRGRRTARRLLSESVAISGAPSSRAGLP